MLIAAKVVFNTPLVDSTLADDTEVPVFALLSFLRRYLVPVLAVKQKADTWSDVFANHTGLWCRATHCTT